MEAQIHIVPIKVIVQGILFQIIMSSKKINLVNPRNKCFYEVNIIEAVQDKINEIIDYINKEG